MLRPGRESTAAHERLRALTPGWVPTAADVDAAPGPGRQSSGSPPTPSLPPEPGRHALPESRHGGWRIDAAGLRALASLGLAALAGGLVVVVVGWPRGDVAPPAAREQSGQTQDVLLAPSPSAAGETVMVDLDGRVRRPGVVELPAGARVVDAIEEAGGLAPGADTAALNLAQVLVDGEQVVVPRRGAAAPVAGATGASPGGIASAAPVSINSASEAELDTLPGIGPVLAAAIVEWRTQNGGFSSIEQLQEVSGIGPSTYAELAPLVRL